MLSLPKRIQIQKVNNTALSKQYFKTEGRTPGNFHYDLLVTLKGGKKERQHKECEDQDQPIRTLQEQPTRMLSAHLINIEIELCPGEHG
jgi:hypothetical protein